MSGDVRFIRTLLTIIVIAGAGYLAYTWGQAQTEQANDRIEQVQR